MNTDESDTIIFGYDPIVFLTGNSCCAKKLEKSVVNKTLYKLVACKCISCGTMYPFESIKNQLVGEDPYCSCGGFIASWELKRCAVCKTSFYIPKPYCLIITPNKKMATIYKDFDSSSPIYLPHDLTNPVGKIYGGLNSTNGLNKLVFKSKMNDPEFCHDYEFLPKKSVTHKQSKLKNRLLVAKQLYKLLAYKLMRFVGVGERGIRNN